MASGMMVVRGRGEGVLLFVNGSRVSDLQDGKVLRSVSQQCKYTYHDSTVSKMGKMVNFVFFFKP